MGGMSVVAHGIDMVDCRRMEEMKDRYGERFLRRVFTPAELAYCLGRKRQIEHLAGRFAAKEAVLKVLGTGWRQGINWTDVEVVNEPSGQPRVRLAGRCRQLADERNIADILVSISHIETHAIASAVATTA
jgi:holo-[acyl-carrier protein] synthase